ncbi:MAG: hypothetical protein V3T72_10820, partial [Thermoanaerobaculia bacterium]
MRRILGEVRQFAVECLCLCLLLYGEPALALSAVARPSASKATAASGDPLGSASAKTGLREAAAQTARWLRSSADRISAGAGELASEIEARGALVLNQPWLDAYSVLLATAGLAEQEDPPPSPRSPPAVPGHTAPVRRPGIPGVASPDAGLKGSPLDEIPLLAGWNLVSLPEEPSDTDPAVVLSAIGGAFSKAWTYDGCDAADPWKLYDPADPGASDLTAIDHRAGLWIEATTPVGLPSDGTLPPSTSFELCAGWNLIGFPAGQPRHVRNALQSIAGKYLRIFGYDVTDVDDPWEIYDVAVPAWANDLELMHPGRGYWILVTEDVSLEIANQGVDP